MLKRLCFVFIVLLLFALCGVSGWYTLSMPESDPVYAGKPLSYWMGNLENGAWPEDAAQKLGTNTAPVLARALEHRETLMRRTYISMWPRLPNWLRAHLQRPTDDALVGRLKASALLLEMGKDAQPAIPQFIQILKKDHNDMLRTMAVLNLGSCQSTNALVMTALNEATHDSSPQVRREATRELKKIEAKAAAGKPPPHLDLKVRQRATN